MADYRLVTGGVRRASDGAFIPDVAGNRDWIAYQTWLAVPNTPDPILVPSLGDHQAAAKASVGATAAALGVTAGAPATPVDLFIRTQLEAQAVTCDGDLTPTTGEYPLLDARVAASGESLAAAADAVIAAKAALLADLVDIEEVRYQAFADIDDAANIAAVDAVVAAITWP